MILFIDFKALGKVEHEAQIHLHNLINRGMDSKPARTDY